jgi:hypothetical protein
MPRSPRRRRHGPPDDREVAAAEVLIPTWKQFQKLAPGEAPSQARTRRLREMWEILHHGRVQLALADEAIEAARLVTGLGPRECHEKEEAAHNPTRAQEQQAEQQKEQEAVIKASTTENQMSEHRDGRRGGHLQDMPYHMHDLQQWLWAHRDPGVPAEQRRGDEPEGLYEVDRLYLLDAPSQISDKRLGEAPDDLAVNRHHLQDAPQEGSELRRGDGPDGLYEVNRHLLDAPSQNSETRLGGAPDDLAVNRHHLQNTPQDVSEQRRGGGLEDLYEVNRSRLLDAPPQMSEQHTPVRKEVASSPSTALTPLKSRRAMIRAKQNLNKKKAPPPLPLGAPVRAHLS